MNISWLDVIIKSKLFNYKFFGFNKNKTNFKLDDYKHILSKIIDDKKTINDYIKNGFHHYLFLPLYLNKVFNNDVKKNPTYLIFNGRKKSKRIIYNKKNYIYYTKISNEKDNENIISYIYIKEDKNLYIKIIKSYYPYYTYLNTYSKEQLKDIYNKICINKNKIKNENNSCYIDSFIYSLFNTKNKNLEKILLNAPINNYNLYLYEKGLKIQNELKNIYNKINDNNDDNKDNDDIYICKNLRRLLQSYYNYYNEKISKLEKIDLISSQNDYYEIINIFNIIFNIPDVLQYSINNNIEKEIKKIMDLMSNNLNYIYKEIEKFYPKRINKIFIDDNPKPIKVENIEYVKSPMLFIHFNRNYLDIRKIKTPIIPTLKIKMKDNKYNLYLNSIIIHEGRNVKYGHYISLYECKGVWYKFDDLNNEKTLIGSFDEIIKNNDYLENIVGLYYF